MIKLNFGAYDEADVHIDQMLSNVAMNYRPKGLIADQIAPIVEVQKQSDLYAIFSRADALRLEEDVRAPGDEARKIYTLPSSDTYYCKPHALKMPVTIEQRANADPIFVSQLINGRVRFITDKLLLNWEDRVTNQVTSGSNVGSYAGVGSAWSSYTVSHPDVDMENAMDIVMDLTGGYRANRAIFGYTAWKHFRRNSRVRSTIFNNAAGIPSTAQVADMLELETVLVAKAYKNTGNEAQSEALSQLWDDKVLVYYSTDAPSLEDPSFMYTFRWAAPGIPNMQAERHPYNTRTKSEEVEVGMYQDEKITGSEYAYLIVAVTSST